MRRIVGLVAVAVALTLGLLRPWEDATEPAPLHEATPDAVPSSRDDLAAPALAGRLAQETPEPVEPVAAAIEAWRRVGGLVLDYSTDKPLKGVRVRVRRRLWAPGPDGVGVHDFETTTDAAGRYELPLPGRGPARKNYEVRVDMDGYIPQRHRVEGSAPGGVGAFDAKLVPAMTVAGAVVDQSGNPVAGAWIAYETLNARGGQEHTRVIADKQGRFYIAHFPRLTPPPRVIDRRNLQVGHSHAHSLVRSADLYRLSREERMDLEFTLKTGPTLAGRVEDEKGRPLDDAIIEVWSDRERWRRAAQTDAKGEFEMRSLVPGKTRVRVLHFGRRQRAEIPILLKESRWDMTIQTEALPFVDPETVEVLGMRVASVTPRVRAALFQGGGRGVLVVEPGSIVPRLYTHLRAGHVITHAGGKPCKDVRQMLQNIVAFYDAQRYAEERTRVPFTFVTVRGPEYTGIHIATAQVAGLRRQLETLR